MADKTISCVRTEIDQNKIESYHQLVEENNNGFKDIAKQISLAGNEVRLKILWLLARDEFCVCDLSDILQMSVPAVSQHLRKLKDNNMVDYRRDGQTLFYFIHPEISEHIKAIIKESFAQVQINI